MINLNNKKGNVFVILLLIASMFFLLFMALLIIFGSATLNLVMDEIVPEVSDLGMVGNSNFTQIASFTITPVNTIIQNFTWIAGLIYVFGIFGILGIAFAFKSTGERWLIALFIGLMLILIISCIFISNIYEEFYSGTDDVALRLKEHVLLSYMILYSPAVMIMIAFLSGIILFSGQQEGF